MSYQSPTYNLPRKSSLFKEEFKLKSPMLQIPQDDFSLIRKIDHNHVKRTRKHRLLEERNTEIEKSNRMLFEKIRKIKLRGGFQSEKNVSADLQQSRQTIQTKPLSLPLISNQHVSTESHLANILANRRNFVQNYFQDINNRKADFYCKSQDLGNFFCYGWKVKVILLDKEHLILKGKKGQLQRTKKYIYSKVKQKMNNGLQDWVNKKFQFES